MKKIINNRNNFENLIKYNFKNSDVNLIMLAYRLSKYGHRNQKRIGGERYFEHPRRIALILMNELGIFEKDMIIAALLHDILEDSFILEDNDIYFIFGERVSKIVNALTKNKNEEKIVYLERIKNTDKSVRTLKLADRLDNLRDIQIHGFARWKRYILQTKNYILPWAGKTNKKIFCELRKICEEGG